MQGAPLYRDINLDTINLDSLLRDISNRRLTGYARIVYWDTEDYIFYLEGTPKYALRVFEEGRSELLSRSGYTRLEKSGTFSFYSTSILDLLSVLRTEREELTPFNFVPYGDEFLPSMLIAHTSPEKVFEQAKRSHFYGYAVFFNTEDFLYMVFLANGEPIRAYPFTDKAITLTLDPDNTYISLLYTEPELVYFLASMGSFGKQEAQRVRSNAELKLLINNLKANRMSFLIDMPISPGFRFFAGLYSGVELFRLYRKVNDLLREEPQLKEGKSYKVNIYSINVKTSFEPVSISFNLQREAKTTRSGEVVKPETLRGIKQAFIEEIGPIGPLVWNKVLKDLGYTEDSITMEELRSMVNMLAKEIPDEKHAKNFEEKARRWLT